MERFTYFYYHLFWEILDWIFPPVCSGCGKSGERWCSTCDQKLIPLPDKVCQICGYPIDTGATCDKCLAERPGFTSLRSIYVYQDEIRNALHRLKYSNDLGVGEIMGQKCANYLNFLDWDVDLIIPVPLGKRRRRERGYNQSALIAFPLALIMKIPYSSKALFRKKETVTQIDFKAEERKLNVKDAFSANSTIINGKSVLIIDDVITTGSTMDACAAELINSGARNVYGLSVARTMIGKKFT
jgi:competence protein ComFC